MDWIGLGQQIDGLDWIGFQKMDPCTTLLCRTFYQVFEYSTRPLGLPEVAIDYRVAQNRRTPGSSFRPKSVIQ